MTGATRRKRVAPSKPICSEADVQRAVTELLQLDGWRAIRTDPTSDRARGKGFGELGMPDYLYLRYWAGYRPGAVHDIDGAPDLLSETQCLWIEFKRKGKKAQDHQRDWHDTERRRGALVLVVDDIDEFMTLYAQSGLCCLASLIAAKKGKNGG